MGGDLNNDAQEGRTMVGTMDVEGTVDVVGSMDVVVTLDMESVLDVTVPKSAVVIGRAMDHA